MFHLGWFLNGTSVPAFGRPWSGNIGRQWRSAELFIDLARAMERAAFDYVLVEDNAFVGDRYQDSMELYLKHAFQTPRQDPVVVATLLLANTRHLGVIPTIGTYAYHPYLMARMIGSLDQLGEGRAGCNLVTGTSDRAAQNYGLDAMEEHDLRYEKAEEFIEVARRLWSSWEPDAVLADRIGGTFAEHKKVHRIDYEGRWFSSRGPLNSGPVSEGGPVVAQAGASPRGRDFAAKYADTIISSFSSTDAMRGYRVDVRERVAAAGRDPDDVKILFTLSPHVCATDDEAEIRRREARRELEENVEVELAKLSKSSDVDFDLLPLDVPLGEVDFETNGTQSLRYMFDRYRDKTLREAVVERGIAPGTNLYGTPDTIAHEMIELADEIGGDGFLIATNGVTRHVIAEVTDGLVPRLQDLGAVRRDYEPGATLRENLTAF